MPPCHWLERTQIILDPSVEDYFIRLDPEASFADYHTKHGDAFARWYETGRVVIMDQVPIRPNYDLLWKVMYPYGKRDLKKLKVSAILAPIQNSEHVLSWLSKDEEKLSREFQKEVSRISAVLMQAAATLFPRYSFIGDNLTWRFSVTHTEGLHFDIYTGKKPIHILRMFFNVDSFPRIWALGDRSETLLSNCNIDHSWGTDPNSWNKRLTEEHGGDTFGYQPTSSPQHIVLFAPGSMWIVHTQYVFHGPIFGRRMVAVSINVAPKSMNDPSLVFSNMPSRLHPQPLDRAKGRAGST